MNKRVLERVVGDEDDAVVDMRVWPGVTTDSDVACVLSATNTHQHRLWCIHRAAGGSGRMVLLARTLMMHWLSCSAVVVAGVSRSGCGGCDSFQRGTVGQLKRRVTSGPSPSESSSSTFLSSVKSRNSIHTLLISIWFPSCDSYRISSDRSLMVL